MPLEDAEHPFAAYARLLERGPGRSRALSRDEARTALGMILRDETDPHQTGAFLMLLRYRGEDPDGMAGLVEAAREHLADAPEPIGADLDWPSYGAGRTRGAPWFLLSALALAQAGFAYLPLRNPARPVAAHLLAEAIRHEFQLPPIATERPGPADFVDTWREETAQTPTVVATIALALLAMNAVRDPTSADAYAAAVWRARRPA